MDAHTVGSTSPSGRLVMPLEEVHRSYLHNDNHTNTTTTTTTTTHNHNNISAGTSPSRSHSQQQQANSMHTAGYKHHTSNVAAPVVTAATADFQRGLIQQQLHQAQREVRQLKDELYDLSSKMTTATTKLSEEKVEYTALAHRYSTTVEKLTNCEGDVKKLEQQLTQERTRANSLLNQREEMKLQLRDAQEECGQLRRELQSSAASKGLDQREVQRMLEDRTQYIPALEVRRMQSEVKDTQQNLLDRLTSALDNVLNTGAEGETSIFVARSAVLSAATDLEARVLRAEAALDAVRGKLSGYTEDLEAETSDFLLALMAENKELWEHITKLQSEHDLVVAELDLKARRGDAVPADKHQYVQRQLTAMTERMQRAQQLVEAQTALAREHEGQMQALLTENTMLSAKVEELSRSLSRETEASKTKSQALEVADTTLASATQQIRELQDALVNERNTADAAVQRLNSTHTAMQQEYEQRLRQVQSDRTAAEECVHQMEKEVADTQARLTTTEKELKAKIKQYDEYKTRTDEAIQHQQEACVEELHQTRDALEAELHTLREELQRAGQEARSAVLARDAATAEAQSAQTERAALDAELAQQRRDAEVQRRNAQESHDRLRDVLAELEEVRARVGESSTSTQELEMRLQRAVQEREAAAQNVVAERERQEQRVHQIQKEWRASEKARISLQDELKLLRARCTELEAARGTHDRSAQDREQLMRENVRLHEQYHCAQQEAYSLTEQLKAAKGQHNASAQLTQQLGDLQHRLRELPQLRQAADDARRAAIKAKEEAEALRQERDEISAKLDFFLEESKAAALMDEAFDRVVRDAGETVRRLGGQSVTAAAALSPAAAAAAAGTSPSRVGAASETTTPPPLNRSPQRPWKQ